VPLLADGVGIVTSTGSSPSAKAWLNKRVILNPGIGWVSDPDGPESPSGYKIMGGTKVNPAGTLAEVVLIEAAELEEAPAHLSDAEAAALPLTGLTGWRAFFTKSGNAKPGRNILITGIGGGVALMVLLFAVAQGCNVFVSSGSEEKLAKAKELGAAGGVNYKEEGWEKKLVELLPKDRRQLDAIIDGAGGDIVKTGTKILKVSCEVKALLVSVANEITGWWCHISLRDDHKPEDAIPHDYCSEECRSSGLDHGIKKGVCRYGGVCEQEEPEACNIKSCERTRHP
jgi:NADPH:quinone reductase-like Zn-dependent oxidoreductase